MARRIIDVYALGRAIGYTDGETRSITAIEIDANDRTLVVSRWIQHPDSPTPQKIFPTREEREKTDIPEHVSFPALRVDEVFYFEPAPVEVKPEPVYARISKSTIKALKRMQWGI